MTYENPTGPQQGHEQPAFQQQGFQQPGYPQQGYPQQPGWGQPAQIDAQQERTWASAAHWSAILIGFLGPLLIMLTKGNESPFVKRQATEALNFQLTLLIAWVVSGILTLVLIGIVMIIVVAIISIVFPILAAVAANKGEWYRYPLTIPFLK